MTTILNQVTCSVCNTKTDETERNEHLVSTNHFELRKNLEDEIPIKSFERIFTACPKKSKIHNLKIEKTHDFRQLHFSTKLPKEKFNILCSDSIDNSELEGSLSIDF